MITLKNLLNHDSKLIYRTSGFRGRGAGYCKLDLLLDTTTATIAHQVMVVNMRFKDTYDDFRRLSSSRMSCSFHSHWAI